MARQVDSFADSIREGIEKVFPTSKVNVKVDGGRLGKGNIFISFTLWSKYPNNIVQNDPSYTQMWVWKSHLDDGTLREDMALELSMGNRLYGYNASTLEKRIGFRGVKSGDNKKVLRAILNYFKKLKKATETHKDALQESYDLYVSRGSIKVASRRTASDVLRSLEGRIARLERQSSSAKPKGAIDLGIANASEEVLKAVKAVMGSDGTFLDEVNVAMYWERGYIRIDVEFKERFVRLNPKQLKELSFYFKGSQIVIVREEDYRTTLEIRGRG